MLPGYFWNGCQHFLFALVCAITISRLMRINFLKNPTFLFSLTFGSSALFFLPAHISDYGSWLDYIYQFLHYPLPDWDILLLGMDWHRFFLTHSLLIPLLILLLPKITRATFISYLLIGLAIGISSHLFWDAITSSMFTPIVFINNVVVIKGYLAKAWLIFNALLLLIILGKWQFYKVNQQ